MIGDPLILSQKDYDRANEVIKNLKDEKIILIGGTSGSHKCFGKGTKILMYDTSLKNVEDIKVGDELLGPDGTKRTVKKIHSGMDNLYKVKQKRGISYIVNSNHLLCLKYYRFNTRAKKRAKDGYINIDVKSWNNLSNYHKLIYKGYKSEGFDLPHKKLALEPYFLGLWLGDGRNSSQEICSKDFEIRDYLQDYANRLDMKLSVYCDNSKKRCNSYSICRKNQKKLSKVLYWLRDLKILNNKHIPYIYKWNTKQVRLELLAGLLDTDGCYTKNNEFTISTKYLKLANDICWLCSSLGFYCSCTKFKVKNYPDNNYYRINIDGFLNTIPTRILRKKAKPRKQVKNHLISGIDINYIEFGYYYGFEVDKDHLFLLEDFTVVHNSELSYCIQKLLSDKRKSSLVISLDDYYSIIPSLRAINRKKMGLDSVGLSEIDWENLQRIYEDFNNKREIHFKRLHRFLDTVEHNAITNSEDINYVLFEGLYANYLRKFYNDNFSVFLEGSPTQTLEFRKLRGKEDENDTFRKQVVEKEYRVVSQLRRYADMFLSHESKS